MLSKPVNSIGKKWPVAALLGLLAIPLVASCSPGKVANDATDKKPARVGKIVFGESVTKVDPKTNNGRPLKIDKPHTSFKPDTPFAYLAFAEEAFGTNNLKAVWTSVVAGGEPAVMLEEDIKVEKPTEHRNVSADWEKASELMNDWAAGKYKLQILRGTAVMAEGAFDYAG